MKYKTVKNCYWADEAQTIINCEVDFDDLQEEFVPFSAVATDPYPHVQEIYNRAVAGDFGSITPYTPPPPPTTEQKALVARAHRSNLLQDLDAITANPLRWTSFTPEKQQEYAVYRQALLDVPQQATFPENIIWPTPPQ